MILKQSTQWRHSFLMVSNADHVSGKTGLNGTVTVKLGKVSPGGVSVITAANSGANVVEIDNINLPGIYYIDLTAADLNTLGEVAFAATGTGADPTNETIRIDTNLFSDLAIFGTVGNGRVYVYDNIQQNTSLAGFTFMMVDSTTGQRKSGLTVTAQRTLGGGGFAPCSNPVTEITGTGIYAISFSAADTNSAVCGYLFTATGASDLYIPLIPTP